MSLTLLLLLLPECNMHYSPLSPLIISEVPEKKERKQIKQKKHTIMHNRIMRQKFAISCTPKKKEKNMKKRKRKGPKILGLPSP